MMSGNKEVKRIFPERIMDSCEDCPYCQWDSEPCGPDGHKCYNEDTKRWSRWIITDSWKSSQETDRIPIPDWCPLEKVGVKSDE